MSPELGGLPERVQREIKVVVDGDTTLDKLHALMQRIPEGFRFGAHRYVQPLYEDPAAWARALALVLEAPSEWKLSLQTHKWIGCR